MDCRAKEAESLGQAKQAKDDDLRNLYATIANQWRLLAEDVDARRANARDACPQQTPSVSRGSDALVSDTKAAAEAADAGPAGGLDHHASQAHEQVVVKAGCIKSFGEQIAEVDEIGSRAWPDAGHVESYSEQFAETDANAKLVSPGQESESDNNETPCTSDVERNGLERIESQHEETDSDGAMAGSVAERVDGVHDRVSEATHNEALLTSKTEHVESVTDKVAEIETLRSDLGRIGGLDDEISEVKDAAVRPDALPIQNIDVQFAQTHPNDPLLSSHVGLNANPVDQLSAVDPNSAQISPAPSSVGSVAVNSLAIATPPSRPIPTPL